jgi:O-methyltransferase involved in polyketide biosynthesis
MQASTRERWISLASLGAVLYGVEHCGAIQSQEPDMLVEDQFARTTPQKNY